MPLVRIDCQCIKDWNGFHDAFARAFGFPSFYGRNMDAWIDCMTYLDDPEARLTTVTASSSDPVALQLDEIDHLPREIYEALVECTAFVNWRRIDSGLGAILTLSFHKDG